MKMTNRMVEQMLERELNKKGLTLPRSKAGRRLARKQFREVYRKMRLLQNRGRGRRV